MIYLENDIKYIKGVGEKRAQLFNKLGIFSVGALLSYYPRNYEDWSKSVTVKEAVPDQVCCIKATMTSTVQEHRVRKGMVIYKCNFSDGETIIHVTIFNNKYLAAALNIYEDYLLFGKVEKTLTYASMSSPRIEKALTGAHIRPIYPATDGLGSRAIERAAENVLNQIGELDETLSPAIREKYNLAPYHFSVKNVHFPESDKALMMARRRLIFEELLVLQLALRKMKSRVKSKSEILLEKDFSDEFWSLLPFSPTNAQLRVVKDCVNDMKSDVPMNRLVQGDVGSGKTAVAAGVIFSAVKNGYQCALMAPTEILATQHFETLKKLLGKTGFSVELLTGSVKASEKKKIKSRLMDGEIQLIIGTHALIQNDVEFKNLGLVVTDEQHRFGVKQRAALADKGTNPHLLVMSATPIPRTLAMIIYGDLDISIIDEMPAGRQVIDTLVVNSSYHQRVYNFIKKALDEGHQAYIVCPLVDEGETELTPAKEYSDQLAREEFRGYSVGLLHGKMKPKDKDSVMKKFAYGEIQLLVSTTVVEVGVDVPNATIMLIENADRFGLSQLHQLRGRVGRGKEKSYCVLVSDNRGETARKRLGIMKKTCDGFIIADQDLKLRGPGDFFGNRQHGLPELKIADMLEDMDTLKEAQECAEAILKADKNLDLPENSALCTKTQQLLCEIKE